MKLFFIILILYIRNVNSERIVCYMSNWAQYRPGNGKFLPTDIDPFLCTHLIYSFAKLVNNKLAPYEWNDDPTEWSKGLYEQTTDLKKVNSNLKVLLAIGGWNMGSEPFKSLVSSDSIIDAFVDDSITFLKKRNFDGLDLDWEYPVGYKSQFTKLCQKLKAKFTPNNLLVSAAVAAGKSNIDLAYNVLQLADHLDFLNVMTYDYHGPWDTVTGHNAPLYKRSSDLDPNLNINFTINYYLQLGFPAKKMNLGMATYGRSLTLSNSNQNTIGSPISGPGTAGIYTKEAGFLSYYEICELSAWNLERDTESKVPYKYFDKQWIGFDDLQSLREKVNYAKSKNLGGVMFWVLDADDFNGQFCGQGKYPLINGVKQYLNNILNVSTQSSIKTVSILTTKASTAKSTTIQKTTTKKMTTTSTTAKKLTTTSTTAKKLTTTSTTAKKLTTTSTTVRISSITSLTTKNSDLCFNNDGFYPVLNTGCKEFYRCTHSGTIWQIIERFKCPTGTLFNYKTNNCDWISNVICSED